MHGSKARIAKFVVDKFPDNIDNYYEPFCGRGNIFFRYINSNKYREGSNNYLNDKFMSHFLASIQRYDGDFSFIPDDEISREVYDKYCNSPDSLERNIAEAVLAYNGNIFGAGANITVNSKNKHSKAHTVQRLIAAKFALDISRPVITRLDFVDFLATIPQNETSFVYLDPPYLDTTTFYSNINHNELITTLNDAKYKWAISGYDSVLYATTLKFLNRFEVVRASTAKCNAGASGR